MRGLLVAEDRLGDATSMEWLALVPESEPLVSPGSRFLRSSEKLIGSSALCIEEVEEAVFKWLVVPLRPCSVIGLRYILRVLVGRSLGASSSGLKSR